MMTTKQAIHLLHRLQDEQFDGIHGDERREALEMAVRALEQNLVKESDGLVNDLVKDCISRQQAIDAVVSAMIDGADAELVEGVMELLPSAQPVNYGSTKSGSSSQLKLNNDLISRQAVIVVFENSGLDDDSKDTVVRVLEQLPSAQPERKRGHWIDMDSDLEKYDDIKCSCCKHEFTVDSYHWTDIGFIKDDLNFCPNCGADMRGESDEML